jgi:hypothetical protein
MAARNHFDTHIGKPQMLLGTVLAQLAGRFWCKVAGLSRTGIMAKMTATGTELFQERHFDQQVIILCVRWYRSYKLSSRDLVDMMGERGIESAHTTILRRVQRYVPEFEKR